MHATSHQSMRTGRQTNQGWVRVTRSRREQFAAALAEQTGSRR